MWLHYLPLPYKCVDVAKWPKMLASFFRGSLGFEPSHGTHRQATLVVEGGFGHGPQHHYLQCLGRLSPLHEHRCSKSVAECFLWGRRRQNGEVEISATVTMPASHICGRRKNLSLPYDLWMLWVYYLYLFLTSIGHILPRHIRERKIKNSLIIEEH